MAKAKEPKPAKEKKPKAAKSKGGGGGIQALLLKKGEWIALGGAGLCLAILLLWGVRQGAKAVDPDKESKLIVDKSNTIMTQIQRGEARKEDVPAIPAWVNSNGKHTTVPVNELPFTGPLFDITARPDTKRDNPIVFGVDEYQVDLVRAPMKAYDIRQTGQDKYSIAVRTVKETGKLDQKKVQDAKDALLRRQGRGGRGGSTPNVVGGVIQPPMGGGAFQPPPGGAEGPPGMGGFPPGMGGFPPGMGGGSFGFGSQGGFDTNAPRAETVIDYVPLETLDTAIAANKIPAPTIVPLRMVVIHATIPLKKQVEEIKRALRMPTYEAAAGWGPIYDGYEIQRREIGPRGGAEWPTGADAAKPNYDFEAIYDDMIGSRKLADHFESIKPDDPSEFLPYFLRYEQKLVLPLPELVKELGAYPEIRLPLITDTIKKLIQARKPAIKPSDLLDRLKRGGGENRYLPQGSATTGSLGLEGSTQAPGGNPRGGAGGATGALTPSAPPGTSGAAIAAGGGNPRGGMAPPLAPGSQEPIEIENLLLRFIDCDVKPGHKYEYRIRLKMKNPNYGGKETGEQLKGVVLNPAWATDPKFRLLYSPWVTLTEKVGNEVKPVQVSIPQENFLFAFDPETYRKNVDEMYKGATMSRLKSRFQAKDNQAVVQIQQWRQEVRTTDGKREPVGAWIVTEMPVGRGEYIGRKQYVKLPLWSSELENYVLREIPDKVMKGQEQPKGWLVDFTDQAVLIDFEGGKVRANVGGKDYTDDVAEELLILGRDGKLTVRTSIADETDLNRKAYTGIWETWLRAAESRKAPAAVTGKGGEFEGKP